MGFGDTLATARAGGHGVKFFVAFFAEYPKYQEYFPKLKGLSGDALENSPALADQAEKVLNAIEKFAAGDRSVIVAVGKTHVGYKVTDAYFEDALNAFAKYLGANGLDASGLDIQDILGAFREGQ